MPGRHGFLLPVCAGAPERERVVVGVIAQAARDDVSSLEELAVGEGVRSGVGGAQACSAGQHAAKEYRPHKRPAFLHEIEHGSVLRATRTGRKREV